MAIDLMQLLHQESIFKLWTRYSMIRLTHYAYTITLPQKSVVNKLFGEPFVFMLRRGDVQMRKKTRKGKPLSEEIEGRLPVQDHLTLSHIAVYAFM